MAAADVTLRIAANEPVLEHIVHLGNELRQSLDAAARSHGFQLQQLAPYRSLKSQSRTTLISALALPGRRRRLHAASTRTTLLH